MAILRFRGLLFHAKNGARQKGSQDKIALGREPREEEKNDQPLNVSVESFAEVLEAFPCEDFLEVSECR